MLTIFYTRTNILWTIRLKASSYWRLDFIFLFWNTSAGGSYRFLFSFKYQPVCPHHNCWLSCKGCHAQSLPPTLALIGNSLNICISLLLGEQLCLLWYNILYDNITVAGGAWGYQSDLLPQHTPGEGKMSLFYTAEQATNPRTALTGAEEEEGDDSAPTVSPPYVGKQECIHLSILKCFISSCMRHGHKMDD